MTDALTDDQKSNLLGNVPAGRLGEAAEIAAAVAFLASDEAGYMTGATLHINGGDGDALTTASCVKAAASGKNVLSRPDFMLRTGAGQAGIICYQPSNPAAILSWLNIPTRSK